MEDKLVRLGKTITILLATTFLLSQCNSESPTKRNLEAGFINPPLENRPLAFWDWLNGYVDTARMVYELEEMKDKGMQGVLIWDVGALLDPGKMIPAGPAFLGEESLEYIALALKTSGRLGLNLGLISASSWNAGGDWIEEADASKELLSTNQIVTGPSRKKITIERPVSRRGKPEIYSLISSVVIPYSDSKEIDYTSDKTINLDEFTSDDKFIEWEVPEGKWDIISFFMCNTGQNLMCPSPNSNGLMIDHLSRKATKTHFDTMLGRLDKVSTPENRLKFLEVDSYEVWPAKDWTPGFVQEFKTRYGYDPTPYLPLLQGYSSKDSVVGKRFLGDYSRLVSDMMIENHFAQSSDIAEEHGMLMFAEAGHGGSARVDPLKALGNSHIPMGEFWNRQRHWVTKEAASAAHIYGKKVVASESLTGWNHWQHGPTNFKQLCDIVFCNGLNQVFFHTFAHNPEIAGKPGFVYHAGEHINVNTTWWEMAGPFMDYLSRCSYMLRQGNFVGDACLYYGDQAPNLVPPKRIDPNIKPIFGDSLCLHCGRPKPVDAGELPGYDYDYINADIITTTLTAEDGKLVLPTGQSYRVMLLPDRDDISLEVLKSLEKLVSDGAIVIGRRPERTTSLKNYPDCDTEVKTIADKLWGQCDGVKIFSNNYGKGTVYWGKSVKEVLEELNIPPDFEVKGIDNRDRHIDYIHRRTDTEDIYFVSNSNQKEEEFTCIFRVDKNWIPEIWDAETGLIQREVEYSNVENGISTEFIMDPLASRFVVFRNKSTGKNDAELNYDLQYGFHRKQKSGEIKETIDLTHHWKIRFNPEMGGPDSYQLEKLTSWSEIDHEGIRYYSGSASYSRDFSVGEETLSAGSEAFAVFGDIQEMARVFVNGNDCGIVWTPPYKARITPYLKAGTNSITVQVINTWNNRIVGDVRNPDKKPFTKTNAKIRFNEDSPLLRSGLMGKAEILFVNRK
ncbi:MAG: hypothetical protein AMS26_20640 [Bacteroides sp. SM23_62]|nr:MAG: hypothetical protein AMS26_20640 [Bacteroides sp. SM23_62]